MFTDYFCAYCTLVNTNYPSHAVFSSFSAENPPCFVVFRTCSAASSLTNGPGCSAKISPLKQSSIFMQSRKNGLVWLENGIRNFTCLNQASNVHPQLRFMAGIWTTAISYKSKAALSMWTFLGGNTQRVHFFYFIDSASIRAILLF